MLRMLLFLADLGLLALIWNLYQARETKYDLVGFTVIYAPRVEPARVTVAAKISRFEGLERNFIKDVDLDIAGTAVRRRSVVKIVKHGVGGGQEARPETRQLVADAASLYFSIKRNPKFKNSPTLRAWTSEFLSFPDLKAADDHYHQDHDGVRFLVEVGRSPNFQLLLGKYLGSADIQSFIREVLGQPTVAGALHGFLKDFNLEAAAANLWPAVGDASKRL